MSEETIVAVAKAAEAASETTGKLIEATSKLGCIFKGSIADAVGILEDRVKFARWERQLALFDKAQRIMASRGLKTPTRELPLTFVVPLLTSAVIEENDELQETWAKLLINAGDATTDMELRTAYVEILRGMSAFDVRNLSKLAEATLSAAPERDQCFVGTMNLPHFSEAGPGSLQGNPVLSREVSISIANLIRLGCIVAPSGFGGGVIFFQVLVTELGLALYQACT
jgi:hypothetical protein